MDWWQCHKGATACAFILMFVTTSSASGLSSGARNAAATRNFGSPYLDMVMCPLRAEPWTCARQQSARLLNLWDEEVHMQWRKLQVEADRQLNATLEKRGYSTSETLTKEKPSVLLKKIEIGSNYMKEFLAETMDGFLGREYEYQQSASNGNEDYTDRDENAIDDDDDEDDDNDNVEDDEDGEGDGFEQAQAIKGNKTSNPHAVQLEENDSNQTGDIKATSTAVDDGVEFFEIDDDAEDGDGVGDDDAAVDTTGQLKRPGGGNKRKKIKNKNKNKNKKGQHAGQPATLVLVQEAAHPVETWSGGSSVGQGHGHGGGGGRPSKQKRKKRKKQQQQQGGVATVVVEEQTGTGHLGLDLLDELVHSDDLLSGSGGKRKQKRPSKYGRSNGVTRGKKKKKRKALAKLVLLGTFLKAKIELLLKILGAHLQIKFFAIALIGLLINIARFWIDVKRGGVPQKVVYVEHAHHQHHYEEHGDEWNEPAGGYWKRRSMSTDSNVDEEDDDAAADATHQHQQQQQYQQQPQHHQQYQQQYQQQKQQRQHDPQYMAYRNQWLQ